MSSTSWKHLTAALIVVTAFIWAFWDTLAVEFGGPNGTATESTTIGTWLDDSVWLCGALAFLVMHFYASGKYPLTYRHAIVAVIAGIVGYVVTRLS